MLTELRLPVALAPRPCVITLVRTWKENSALKRAALRVRLQACEAPTRSQSSAQAQALEFAPSAPTASSSRMCD
jgi:hypothetical protein